MINIFNDSVNVGNFPDIYIENTPHILRFGDLIFSNNVISYLKSFKPNMKVYLLKKDYLPYNNDALCVLSGYDKIIEENNIKDEYRNFDLIDMWESSNNQYKIRPMLDNLIDSLMKIRSVDICKDLCIKSFYDFKKTIGYNGLICINPLVDAQYNTNRNWGMNVTEFTINRLLSLGYIIIGLRSINNENLKNIYSGIHHERFIEVAGDLRKSMMMILMSNLYIGGDTGLTHFANKCYWYDVNIMAFIWRLSKIQYHSIDRDSRNDLIKILKPEYHNFIRDKFVGDLTPIGNDLQKVDVIDETTNAQKILRKMNRIIREVSFDKNIINMIKEKIYSVG